VTAIPSNDTSFEFFASVNFVDVAMKNSFPSDGMKILRFLDNLHFSERGLADGIQGSADASKTFGAL
jgi:hypothetical protein